MSLMSVGAWPMMQDAFRNATPPTPLNESELLFGCDPKQFNAKVCLNFSPPVGLQPRQPMDSGHYTLARCDDVRPDVFCHSGYAGRVPGANLEDPRRGLQYTGHLRYHHHCHGVDECPAGDVAQALRILHLLLGCERE